MSRKKSRLFPARMPDDTTAFKNAVHFLEEMGVKFRRPSLDQLKIGFINYWPNTGTIQKDGERRRRERGKEALRKLLLELAEKNDYYVRMRSAEAATSRARLATPAEATQATSDALAAIAGPTTCSKASAVSPTLPPERTSAAGKVRK